MKIITSIVLLIFSVLILTGCESKPKDKLVNKMYVNEEDGQKQIVGFYEDKIIFKWDDSLGVDYHESEYNVNPVNDSTLNIEVKDKSPYMTSNTWQIILEGDGISFYTADSKKRYVISSSD